MITSEHNCRFVVAEFASGSAETIRRAEPRLNEEEKEETMCF